MSQLESARPVSARRLLECLCTSNPFYVLSAGLFLLGLWGSFGADSGEVDTWILMSRLAGYTLLLAATALLLVRCCKVWDDVRTVLLLVVLMFLATSVTFDEVLVFHPSRGTLCYLVGLLFAIVVSEGLLRGTRLGLPALFRIPYYLTLGLFFLYPLGLRFLLADHRTEAMQWGLFGFCSVAGLVFLTLLPAIRRGSDYVADNGSPWKWPMYPWVLFGLLALTVPARAFLLCLSMDMHVGGDLDRVIFRPYFLVPFGAVLSILLMEMMLVGKRPSRFVSLVALSMPLAWLVLAGWGKYEDAISRGFLETFTHRLGGDPFYLALWASAGFFAYAAHRRVRWSVDALTLVLVGLAFVGPRTWSTEHFDGIHYVPLSLAALLQLGLGIRRRSAWSSLLGSGGAIGVASLVLFERMGFSTEFVLISAHLALIPVFLVGGVFDTRLARGLRVVGALAVTLMSLAPLVLESNVLRQLPEWLLRSYPPLLAILLGFYSWRLVLRTGMLLAFSVLISWLSVVSWGGYLALRESVVGLDYILLSLAFFGIALLVSFAKAGQLSRAFPRREVILAMLQIRNANEE